ncbi:BLUF domain-containing protein [Spirosoma pomorum]|jgi:hypothetical protein
MDHCIIYFSSSVKQLQEEDLTTILQQSRQNNSQVGVTGVMLYVRGSIIQVLEGQKEIIESLYQRIEKDPRHQDVVRVFSRPITKRLFGDWNMGYETITTRQLEDVKRTINLDPFTDAPTMPDEHIILRTIKVFYDSNRYN